MCSGAAQLDFEYKRTPCFKLALKSVQQLPNGHKGRDGHPFLFTSLLNQKFSSERRLRYLHRSHLMISPEQKEHALEVLKSLQERCGVGVDSKVVAFLHEYGEGTGSL